MIEQMHIRPVARPLLERLVKTKDELARMIDKSTPASADVQIKLQWYGKFLTAFNICQRDGLNEVGVSWCESLLLQCYRHCGTSLDLMGMVFINVYILDRRRDEDGGYVEFRKHAAYKICDERVGHKTLAGVAARYRDDPRPQTAAEKLDGFKPRYIVLMETVCPNMTGDIDTLN